MDGAKSDLDEAPSERELQVLQLFTTKRRRLQFLAASRCPHDGRLLAGVCRLADGLWAWHAGSRLSPGASRVEIESWHLDRFASEEFTPEIYCQANHLTDELLSGAPRYESPATAVKILSGSDEDGVRVGCWRGSRHPLQMFADGLPLFAYASCQCRRGYQVQMLALVYAGSGPRWRYSTRESSVGPASYPCERDCRHGCLAYGFTDRGVQVVLDER